MLKAHFQTFLAANAGKQHFAAHSHHPWPDVAIEAHQQYALDSGRLADHKWNMLYASVLPEAQQHVARILGLTDPDRIAFAPNTAEFVARLYSCLDPKRTARILTTDAEFHSFRRITDRLSETGWLEITRVPAQPFTTFNARFLAACKEQAWDMVFVSDTHFNSGFTTDQHVAIAAAVPQQTLLVFDGYHTFMARPLNVRAVEQRAFYMAGGYKYAMAGEGACFMHCPLAADALRPVFTGWFADFDNRAQSQSHVVSYGPKATRFWGATFDASGIYRFNAVQRWLLNERVSVADIHRHAKRLQNRFLAQTGAQPLLAPADCGNFLTFESTDAEAREAAIKAKEVYVDRRGSRIRFGFGVYHDENDVDELADRVRTVMIQKTKEVSA